MNTSVERNASEIVVGLDIGTTKIACLVGRKTEHGKIEIIGMGKTPSLGVSRGVVSNIEKTVESIREAVRLAEESSGVEINVVNVGIAGQHISSHQHRGMITRESLEDEISREDIENLTNNMYKLVMVPGNEIIHALPQEFTIDGEQGIKQPIGMSGIRLEANFHIITGNIAAAQNIYKCIKKAGLKVEQLILEPLASAASVLSNEELEAGVVLVDIGGGTTDIAIFQDGIIRHTAVIPFGGNIITEDVKTGCTIMKKQAEQLKVKFGSALAMQNSNNEVVCIPGLRGRAPKEISLVNLSKIIEARMKEIIYHVHSEIVNSGFEKHLIGGIVVTGGGSQMRHITQLFEWETGMTCRIGYPNEHMSKAPSAELVSPMYSTGVGLIIKGYEDAPSAEINEDEENTSKREKGRASLKRTPSFNFLQKIKVWFESEDE